MDEEFIKMWTKTLKIKISWFLLENSRVLQRVFSKITIFTLFANICMGEADPKALQISKSADPKATRSKMKIFSSKYAIYFPGLPISKNNFRRFNWRFLDFYNGKIAKSLKMTIFGHFRWMKNFSKCGQSTLKMAKCHFYWRNCWFYNVEIGKSLKSR